MNPADDDRDRLVDSLLREMLGKEAAPDLASRILARAAAAKLAVRRDLRTARASRVPWLIAMAAAAVLIVVLSFWNARSPAVPPSTAGQMTAAEPAAPRRPDPPPSPPLAPEEKRAPDTGAVRPPQPSPKEEAPKSSERPPPPAPPPAPPAPEAPPERKAGETRVGETHVAALGRIERVEGSVQAAGRAAGEGQELFPGQGIATGAAGRATLRYADGTSLELDALTEIRGLSEARGKTLSLVRGTLAAVIQKQPADRPMVVATPHAEARVLGTAFKLTVDADDKGATRLDVAEGKVRFTRVPDRKSVDVSSGHYAVAAAGFDLLSRQAGIPRPGTRERPVIVRLQVVNAETGQPLLQLDPLEDRAVISLPDLPTRALNIRAVTSPETVGCVVFTLDGEAKAETASPYLLKGNDTKGRPLAWTPPAGDHVLTATPHSRAPAAGRHEGTGTAGPTVLVRFRVR